MNNREKVLKTRSYMRFSSPSPSSLLKLQGTLCNDDGDGNGNENVISKYNFSFLYLFRDYSNLFNVKNAGELSRA